MQYKVHESPPSGLFLIHQPHAQFIVLRNGRGEVIRQARIMTHSRSQSQASLPHAQDGGGGEDKERASACLDGRGWSNERRCPLPGFVSRTRTQR